MNSSDRHLPLGDFLPADRWQTHVNAIFYGTLGSNIHNHFQTYVSRDYRLAYALAEDYFKNARELSSSTLFIQEWGVGNGNLAACFLDRLKEIDFEDKVYSRTRYILCDYSRAILKGVRANHRLKEHVDRFETIQVDAENLDCFKPGSIHKIISNEIWDDLATKVLLKNDEFLYEEYLQPMLNPKSVSADFETFIEKFIKKDFNALKEVPAFLDKIHWERAYQREDISDWPFAKTLEPFGAALEEENPIPVNTGAFLTLQKAFELLAEKSLGYSGMDYGMLTAEDLFQLGRPYFNLYGGQYTFMINFPLLVEVGKAIGFDSTTTQLQHRFVGDSLGENVVSVLELVQTHPYAGRMEPWDRDILMLGTLNALNSNYQSPYKQKMDYPAMSGTPKKFRKKIEQLSQNLNPSGVPDTVAYVTRKEVLSTLKALTKLGYREKDVVRVFSDFKQPISFVCAHFRK